MIHLGRCRVRHGIIGTVATAALLLSARPIHAGGLFFSDRGVRPLGRGGAFVAGADDLNAISYNPAGLVDAPNQFILDASTLSFRSTYQRVRRTYQVDPNTGEPTGTSWDETMPKSKGTSPATPIPMMAVSHNFGLRNTAFALGAYVPYGAASHFDNTVSGQPNPGRYMVNNLDGTGLAIVGLWAAHRFFPWLSVGAGFQMMLGQYQSESVMSTSLPDRFVSANEDPSYDATTQLRVGPIHAPGGNFGIIASPIKELRIGASYQLPFSISAPGTAKVRMPSSGFFDKAYQDGDSAQISMKFPWIARFGVEVRDVLPNTRAEASFVYEAWSMHKDITVVPNGMQLRGVTLFPSDYKIQTIVVPRNFQDTYSLRFGLEHWEKFGDYQLDFRIGVMKEKTAIPREYLTTLTIDLDKVILGTGASLHIGKRYRIDFLYAHAFTSAANVGSTEARMPLLMPVRANPPANPIYVNAGRYEASADIVGLGLAINYL